MKRIYLPHIKRQKDRIYTIVDLGIVKSGNDCKKLLRTALSEDIIWPYKQP